MEKISKKMTIAEVVTQHPETAQVFAENGFHCVGCHMAQMESVEDGCKGHGMDDKAVDEMIDKLNDAIKKE